MLLFKHSTLERMEPESPFTSMTEINKFQDCKRMEDCEHQKKSEAGSSNQISHDLIE